MQVTKLTKDIQEVKENNNNNNFLLYINLFQSRLCLD